MVAAAVCLGACGDDDTELSAEFTGDACVYSGSTDFEVGDQIEVTVSDATEERMEVGFGLLKVVDGTSAEQIHQEGVFEYAEGDPAAVVFAATTEPGTESTLSGTLDSAGTWVVNCFVFGTGNPDGEDFPAAMLDVAA